MKRDLTPGCVAANSGIRIDIDAVLNQVIADYGRTPMARPYPWRDHEWAIHKLIIELAMKHLERCDSPAVLDIGTGRAICPRFFAAAGMRSITLDYPTTGGTDALAAARAAGVEAFACDCARETFPLGANSVDCVLLLDVIEHLPHSPRHMLDEIYGVLRPNGICITSTPNATRMTVRLKVALGHSNWPRISDYFDADYHGGHHHEYTREELIYVHERCGFRVEDVHTIELNTLHAPVAGINDLQSGARDPGVPMRFMAIRRLLNSVISLVPAWQGQMVMVARKPPRPEA